MSRSKEELDDMLFQFLHNEREDPIRERLQHQADWSVQHEKDDATRHAELLSVLQGHSFRIGSLEKVADKLEDDVEDTKNHDVRELQAAQSRLRDNAYKAAFIVITTLLGGGVVELIHRVAGH